MTTHERIGGGRWTTGLLAGGVLAGLASTAVATPPPVPGLMRPAAAIASAEPQRGDFRRERTDRQTRTLQLGPSGSLELRNISGDVTVTSGSGRDVVIEVTRRSHGRTDGDAEQGLRDVQVRIDAQDQRGTVETVYPRGRQSYSVETSYVVTAPPGTRVSAASVSGNVSVRDITADVSAESVSGNVEIHGARRIGQARSVSGSVTITDVDGDSGVTAGSVSGNIALERIKGRRISAEVVSGNITARDVTCDTADLKTLSGNVAFDGRLARGGRYQLTSHSGDVTLTVQGDAGFELQATSFSGNIRPDRSVTLGSVASGRGTLRARSGDGSAVVVLNSFSGNVTIGRR
jgi:DUF4097 and DUF4098 domain-containing protein YvlB